MFKFQDTNRHDWVKISLWPIFEKLKTKSGATAVQIAHKVGGHLSKLEHLGSAHNSKELETLIYLAKEKLRGDQIFLFPNQENKLKIKLKQSSSNFLFQVLSRQYQKLGFSQLNDSDFANLCIARIVEPTSKLDSLRVLSDLGINDLSKDRLYRCLQKLSKKITVRSLANFVLTKRIAKTSIWFYTTLPPYILKSKRKTLIVVQDFPRNGDWNHRLLLDFWLTVQVSL